jgi:hypothetical protein
MIKLLVSTYIRVLQICIDLKHYVFMVFKGITQFFENPPMKGISCYKVLKICLPLWWGYCNVDVQEIWNSISISAYLMHVVHRFIKQLGLDLAIWFAYFNGVFKQCELGLIILCF